LRSSLSKLCDVRGRAGARRDRRESTRCRRAIAAGNGAPAERWCRYSRPMTERPISVTRRKLGRTLSVAQSKTRLKAPALSEADRGWRSASSANALTGEVVQSRRTTVGHCAQARRQSRVERQSGARLLRSAGRPSHSPHSEHQIVFEHTTANRLAAW